MGPWTRDKYGKVIDANGKQVTLTGFASWCGYVAEECHKDDDDVVRAVNSHDDLVAALRGMFAIWQTPLCENLGHEPSEYHKETRDCPVVAKHIAVMEAAQQALAKAEGGK